MSAVTATRSEPAVQFIVELSAALNEAGESVTLNQRRMDRIAAAYGVSDARIAVLPNMVLAAGGHNPTTLARGAVYADPIQRLDRTGAVRTSPMPRRTPRSSPTRACGGWTRSPRCRTGSA